MDPWNILGWMLVVLLGLMLFMFMFALILATLNILKEVVRGIKIRQKVKRMKAWKPNTEESQ